jgi:hypothetical protein
MAAVDWSAVGAVATALTTVLLAVSLVFLWRQVREATKARDVEVMLHLYDRLIAVRPQKLLIYENENQLLTIKSLGAWDVLRKQNPAIGTAVFDVSMAYHLFGLFLESGSLSCPDLFLSDIGEIFLRVFRIIGPIVALERDRSGETYRATLEYLEKRVVDERKSQ